jgi:uncharacterized membrane protein YhaH (DUF805 family)
MSKYLAIFLVITLGVVGCVLATNSFRMMTDSNNENVVIGVILLVGGITTILAAVEVIVRKLL